MVHRPWYFILVFATGFVALVAGVLAECVAPTPKDFWFNFLIELMSTAAGLLAGIFIAERILGFQRDKARREVWSRHGPYVITSLYSSSVEIVALTYTVFREAVNDLNTPDLARHYETAFNSVTTPSRAAVEALGVLVGPLAEYLRRNTPFIPARVLRGWHQLASIRFQYIRTVCIPRILDGADEPVLNEILARFDATAHIMAGKLNYMESFERDADQSLVRDVLEDMIEIFNECVNIGNYLVSHQDRIPATP